MRFRRGQGDRGAAGRGDFQFSPHEIPGFGAVLLLLTWSFNSLLMRFSRRSRRRGPSSWSFQFSPHEIPEEANQQAIAISHFQFSPHEIREPPPAHRAGRRGGFQFSLHEILQPSDLSHELYEELSILSS